MLGMKSADFGVDLWGSFRKIGTPYLGVLIRSYNLGYYIRVPILGNSHVDCRVILVGLPARAEGGWCGMSHLSQSAKACTRRLFFFFESVLILVPNSGKSLKP